MEEVVIDTNVLLVAAGMHPDVSDECLSACVSRLERVKTSSRVVIDDNHLILSEYLKKLDSNQPNVGGAFLKWLLQSQSDPNRVTQVRLTERAPDCFAEFPVAALELEFDAPDRKFPAVANAHPAKPPVLQATDSKWLKWWPALAEEGIRVEFLCSDDICRFFGNKFPGEPVPKLP